MESKKKRKLQMNLFMNRNRLTDIENKLVTKGVSREGITLEFRINRHTLLYVKQTTRTYCRAQGTILNIL